MKASASNSTVHESNAANSRLLKADYRDPLNGGSEDQWVAAFAPVTVKSRPAPLDKTGWFVIVQQMQQKH